MPFLIRIFNIPLEGRINGCARHVSGWIGMSKEKITPNDEKWEEFARLKLIKQDDVLVEGYCIPLDGKPFRIFVGNEVKRNARGYFLKLMYDWGCDTTIDLDKRKADFPQTTEIFISFLPKAWVNKGKTHRCYKYIIFGHGEANKHLAMSLMHSIISSIAN